MFAEFLERTIQISGAALNLFCFHEEVKYPSLNNNAGVNPIFMSANTNHHKTNFKNIKEQNDFLETYTGGANKKSGTYMTMTVFLHEITEKSTSEETMENALLLPIYAIAINSSKSFDAKFMQDESHPTLNISPLKNTIQTITSILRLNDEKTDFDKAMDFIEFVCKEKMQTVQDLKDLMTKLQMESNFSDDWNKDDFVGCYKHFKKNFQRKFSLYVSFLDGNHRMVTIAKLLENAEMNNSYYSGDAKKPMVNFKTSAIFANHTVKILCQKQNELPSMEKLQTMSYEIARNTEKTMENKITKQSK